MTHQEVKSYIESNKEIIFDQIMKKLKSTLIHKHYCDNKTAWWTHIEEPGWDPEILKDIPYYKDFPEFENKENEFVTLMDQMYENSLNLLQLPVDIMH